MIEIAIEILAALARRVPEVAELIAGSSHPLAQRVRDVVPAVLPTEQFISELDGIVPPTERGEP